MDLKSLNEVQAWCNDNLLNRTEAMDITNQSYAAFAQSVYTKQLVPFIEKKEKRPLAPSSFF